MDKRIVRLPTGDGGFLVDTYIYSDPWLNESGKEPAKYALLATLLETPGLLNSGGNPFEKLAIYLDGDRWVARLTATVDLT